MATTTTITPGADRRMTTKEAAAYLGLAPNTLEIWRCLHRPGPAYIKLGAKVVYAQSALDAYLRQQTVNPQAA